jgi:hypothetical protein
MTFEATPLSRFARVMSILMRPMLKAALKACEQDLDDLKTAVESQREGATRVA